MMKKTIMVVR